jgi:putative membrane protein
MKNEECQIFSLHSQFSWRFIVTPQPQPISRWQQFRSLSLRWLINILAIFAAVWLIPGIEFVGPGWQLGVIAAVFGLVNVALRPLLTLLTCPLVILSFGLFGLVINAALLMLTAAIARSLGIQFTVDGFWSAFLGGLVVALVGLALNILANTGSARLVVRMGYEGEGEDKKG